MRSKRSDGPSVVLGVCLAILLGRGLTAFGEGEWRGFRGPEGSAVAHASGLPVTWDSQNHVVWRSPLPGPGTSSPIVVADRVFLTCYSGYGESVERPGDMEDLVRHVVCLQRDTGEILWQRQFEARQPESEYLPGNDSRHGYASSTPASDGEQIYVFFGASGVYCLDLEGNQVWRRDVGSETHGWGSGTSPALVNDVVVVNASIESQSLVALDKHRGTPVWQVEQVDRTWSSPLVVEAGGREEVVLSMPNRIAAFDPATGETLWFCDGIPDGYVCPTVVAHEGIVYAVGGRKNTALAVRAGGRGDVSDSHVLWRTGKGSNVSSPLYLGGRLFWFHESRGIAYCLDASNGTLLAERRLKPRPGLIYSSAVSADGKIYAVSQESGTYVLSATEDLDLLAVNVFEDDQSRSNASIAISRNQILLRTDKALYCLGE